MEYIPKNGQFVVKNCNRYVCRKVWCEVDFPPDRQEYLQARGRTVLSVVSLIFRSEGYI